MEAKVTLPYLIAEKANAHPERIFAYFENETITYGQLHEKTNRLANALVNIGIQKSSHVGIFAQNSPEFLLSWFSLAKIGAVMVPINTRLMGELLAYIINDSDIETMIIEEQFIEKLLHVKKQLKHLKTLIVIWENKAQQTMTGLDYMIYDFKQLVNYNEETTPSTEVLWYEPLSILYTSGTTGPSKGVLLSHHYYYYAGDQYRKVRRLGENDVNYTALPWFHTAAQVLHTIPSFLGSGAIAMARQFDPEVFWHHIKRFRATQFHYLSTMIYMLWNYPEREIDADHEPLAAFGGPTPWNIAEQFAKRFNVVRFIEGFGQTEALYIGTTDYEKTEVGKLIKGSCGRPLEGFEVKIVDEYDREVPHGTIGEIVVRPMYPYTIFSGYYKKPEATLKTLRNLWFHTGDRGYRDDEGNFYFVDRLKDVIRKSGENISSFELESIISKYEQVQECAAIPIKGVSEDEVMVVLTIHGERESFNPIEFLMWCKKNMPYYMIPRYIRIVAELPKTPTHKVEKYKLMDDGVTPDTWDRKEAGVEIRTL